MNNQNQPLLQETEIDTNEVVQSDEVTTTYYLPCYVRFYAKEIISVNMKEMQAVVEGTLIFTFYYGKLPFDLIQQFINKNSERFIILEFNRDEPIQLKSQVRIKVDKDTDKKMITYKIRKAFKMKIMGSSFLAPFRLIDLHFLIVVQGPDIRYKKKKITVKFNCMDSEKAQILRTGQELSYGQYKIARNGFKTQVSKKRVYPFEKQDEKKNQKQQQENRKKNQIFYFQYAHFNISIFKHSLSSILVFFIPLIFLGLIGIFVYFQEQSFGARIANIVVLALTYGSLLSAYNQQIRPSPKIKYTQIIILLELISVVLLLVQSFRVKDIPNYEFVLKQNYLFIISLCIHLHTFLSLTILCLLHQFCWIRKYQQKRQEDQKRQQQKTILKDTWNNIECNKEFNQKKKKFREDRLKNLFQSEKEKVPRRQVKKLIKL